MKTKDYESIGGRVKTAEFLPNPKKEKRPYWDKPQKKAKDRDYSKERARKREEFDA